MGTVGSPETFAEDLLDECDGRRNGLSLAIARIRQRDSAIRLDERRRVATWLRRLALSDVVDLSEAAGMHDLAKMVEEGQAR